MAISHSREAFKAVFDSLCEPDVVREQVEKNGNLSYQRVYDLKRKR